MRPLILLAALMCWCGMAFALDNPSPAPFKSSQHKQAESKNGDQTANDNKREASPPPSGIEVPPPSHTDKSAEYKGATEYEHSLNDRIIAISTAALAIITLGLAIFTWRLWKVTGELVRSADRNAERQLRAYLHTVSAQGVFTDNSFTAKVNVRNFGQTPAYDVVQWIGIVGVSDGDVPNIGPPDDSLSKAKDIIGPGGHTEFFIPLLDEMTIQKKLALKEERATIYVHGEITYRDIFLRQHVTKYRMFIRGEGVDKGQFQSAAEGNEAT